MITKSKNINRPWLRLLCLCLAMCMLVGMLPAMAIAATPKYLYMKPNSNWKVDNARFAAYFFGNGEKWVSGEKVDTDLYKFEVPAGFPNVIFCRMNPSDAGNNWDNRWNQTANLVIPTNGDNCYSIKPGTWDKGGGTWSTITTCKYEGHSGTLSYVPGGNGTHTQKYSCCGEPYGSVESCTNNAEYPCYDGKCKLCGGAVSGVPHVSDAEYSCQAGSCKVCGKEMSQPSHSWSSEYPCQDAVCTICGIDMPKVDHQWKDATCTAPKTCSVCGETEGEALGHDWLDGTCSQPKTCSVCGETDGDVLDHNFIDEKCEYCQLDQYVTIYFQNNWKWSDVCLYYWYSDGAYDVAWPGAAMKVYGNDGTYDVYVGKIPYNTCGMIINGIKDDGSGDRDQTPNIESDWYDGICYYMDWADGNKVGSEDINVILPPCEHIWKNASCNEPVTCELCGATSGEALGHDWDDATCTAPKTCSVCGEAVGEALGHDWDDATCTAPKTCSVCGETEGEALGHDWDDATCTAPKTCSVCGETDGEALGHEWDDATCTAPKTCSVCGETEGEAAGHGYATGFEYLNCTDYHEVLCADCLNYSYQEDHTYDENHYCVCGAEELFTVTFMHDGEVWTVFDRYYNTKVAFAGMDFPTKEGHSFTGWYTAEGEKIYNNTLVTGNMVVSSDFKRNTYNYTVEVYTMDMFGNYGEPVVTAEAAEFGSIVDLTGYQTGEHFYLDGENINSKLYATVPANDDLVMRVYVARKTYDITWILNGCTVVTEIVSDLPTSLMYNGDMDEYGCHYVNMLLDTPAGYRVADYVDGNGNSIAVESYNGHDRLKFYVTGDMTIEVVLEKQTYGVTWNVGGVETTETYEYGQIPEFTGSTDKANNGCTVYTFAGWDQEIVAVTGNVIYTAIYTESTVHVDADNSGRCDFCGCLMQPAKLSMTSISLKGNIAINYYMLLSDEVLADETAYMQFTLADGEIRQIPVGKGVEHEYKGETYYVFSCSVDAKEMTDEVLSQFFYEGGSTTENTYSVQAYADYVLTYSKDENMKALVKAMLNYGAASQIHFGYRTDDLANAILGTPDYTNVTISGFNAVTGQGTELAKLYSASLILKSETTLRFFFKVDSSATFTATYNGQVLEVKERSGLYYVDIVGISAKDLDENVTVTISDGTNTAEVFFNPMSYCQGVLRDTSGAFTAEMKDLVRALYLYNEAANVYFKEN